MSLITCNNCYASFSWKDKISRKKFFFGPELFGSSQLRGFTGKRARACKKTGILKSYFDNP